ncbi:MAG: outer membrane protein [Paracoccaceae bacterium]
MIYRTISLGCVISLGILTHSAQAQDRWAGAYAGVALSMQSAQTKLEGSAVHDFSEDSASLGAFGGYNFVRSNGFVWGPELLVTGLSGAGAATDSDFGSTEMEATFLLSPRVRFGFGTDKTLFYGVLGLGLSDLAVKSTTDTDTNIIASGAIGIGAELALKDGWSARVEAMQYDFDGLNFTQSGGKTPIKSSVQQITLGLSRKF